jgi:hypothetical protein
MQFMAFPEYVVHGLVCLALEPDHRVTVMDLPKVIAINVDNPHVRNSG